jgi:hypothetical protein
MFFNSPDSIISRAVDAAMGRNRQPRFIRGLTFAGLGHFHVEGGGAAGGGAGGGGAGAGGAGGGAAGGGAGGGGDDPPPANTVEKAEFDRVVAQRNANRSHFKGLLGVLGYDPKHTRIYGAGSDDDPYRIEVDGEDVTEEVRAKMAPDDPNKPKPGDKKKPDDKATNDRWKNRLTEAETRHKAQESGLTALVDDLAVVSQLRAACVAEGAIDSGGEPGTYADVIALARPFIKTEYVRDEDGNLELDANKRAQLKVTPLKLDGSGEPWLDQNQKPVPMRKFLAEFLSKRPNFKLNRRPGGPGAGGTGDNIRGGSGNTTPGDLVAAGRAAGQSLFGTGTRNGNGAG